MEYLHTDTIVFRETTPSDWHALQVGKMPLVCMCTCVRARVGTLCVCPPACLCVCVCVGVWAWVCYYDVHMRKAPYRGWTSSHSYPGHSLAVYFTALYPSPLLASFVAPAGGQVGPYCCVGRRKVWYLPLPPFARVCPASRVLL